MICLKRAYHGSERNSSYDRAAMNIEVAVFLFVAATVFLTVLAFCGFLFWYAFDQSRRRAKLRQRIVEESGEIIAGHPWHPVRYATQQRFKSILKFFPWEGAGIVIVSP